MDHVTIYIILAGALGLFMAWGIGANDVANAMGTSIGSKVLTIKQAVIIAGIFEFAGAFLAGGQVTSTIRKGIIDSGAVAQSPDLLIFGNAERQLSAIGHRLAAGELISEITDLRGTAYVTRRTPDQWTEIDSTHLDLPGGIDTHQVVRGKPRRPHSMAWCYKPSKHAKGAQDHQA